MTTMDALETITELSHEFGAPDFVKGGGGNTSVKTGDSLWIKPSGTTLAGLEPAQFVAVDRAKLAALYAMEVPADAATREARVKDLMMAAVSGGSRGRPSVETPLHDLLKATYVVHTHAVLVNGLTCAKDGAAAAARLFPDALWIPYTDPGFTLSMAIRARVAEYEREHGRQPSVILLENHGIFVAADSPAGIREHYRRIIDALRIEYVGLGVPCRLKYRAPTLQHELEDLSGVLLELMGATASFVVSSAPFELAEGPLTPDHMVYAKAYPYVEDLDRGLVAGFMRRHGYAPRVVSTKVAVFALGKTPAAAQLAMEMARDGGLVKQLTSAFGGVRYLSDSARRFIESWEVESYREQQLSR
jgi:rhamnose utilization protein RhaD (predicted bifunctional aldolase and dehydrogenase)